MSKTERLEKARQRTKEKKLPKSKAASSDRADAKTPTSSTLYNDFTIWVGNTIPKWHPIKKMRYVFFRMIAGCTVTDALNEISWSPSEFWHLVELKRHAPFREEYMRAKRLQARSFSDSVVTIAEGRDRITRSHQRKTDRLIKKAMRRIARSKSGFKSKMILSQLMSDLREHDKIIMTRNKLQIESAKWIAKTSNPQEFSETSRVSLNGGLPTPPDGEPDKPILIQFVGPDGKVVDV